MPFDQRSFFLKIKSICKGCGNLKKIKTEKDAEKVIMDPEKMVTEVCDFPNEVDEAFRPQVDDKLFDVEK
jgi:hypothetical protein